MATGRKERTFTHEDRQRFRRAVELYLEECYRQKKAARGQDFAARLGLTAPYASWLATQLLGSPLVDWMRRKQVEYAATLLRRTPHSVEEIAALAAFGTRSTFQRVFMRVKKMTPFAYREQKK
ncbi:MAG TPA: AraC family transcriptional regulator [Thermoanaerobaculia bacterium]|nr:AraC family transcriptional regulator [Thermoanaerobaculia bacterium]